MDDEELLEHALASLHGEAMNFGVVFINDHNVRRKYMAEIRTQSDAYRQKVRSGQMSASQAAREVHAVRDTIMETRRTRLSHIGRAASEKQKLRTPPLNDLVEKNAKRLYNRPFNSLTAAQQNDVYLKVIERSAVANPRFNRLASNMSKVGRGLVVLSLGVAVYNVATAEDKPRAAVREGAVIGGGVLGGAAGGAAAGLICGPGAPVCSTIGVFVGGALGAFGVSWAFSD